MAQKDLINQNILGYTVSEKLDSGEFWTVYKAIKNNITGQYVRALKHITIPTEEQYHTVLSEMGGDIAKTDAYFDRLFNGIVSKIKTINDLSEKGIQYVVKYYENDVVATDSPKQHNIYILMEYLTPLKEFMRSKDFRVKDVINLGLDLLRGLQAYHKTGAICNDINIDNVFVSDHGEYKIGDFNLDRISKQDFEKNAFDNNIDYIAPELYKYNNCSVSSDLYSIGMILYKLLNYQRAPFLPDFPQQCVSNNVEEALYERMSGKSQIKLPYFGGDDIGSTIVKAISFNSVDRFNTAEEFIDALLIASSKTKDKKLDDDIKLENIGLNQLWHKKIFEGDTGEKNGDKEEIIANENDTSTKSKKWIIISIVAAVIAVSSLGCAFVFGNRGNDLPPVESISVESTIADITEDTTEDTSEDTTTAIEETMVVVYSSENETKEVPENELAIWLNEGWYDEPVVKLHQPADWDTEAKEITVKKSQKSKYLEDGWYTYPCRWMYAQDGRSKIVHESGVEAELKVNWYLEPFERVYKVGKEELVKKSEAIKRLASGEWYAAPVSIVYKGASSKIIFTVLLNEYLRNGWSETPPAPQTDSSPTTPVKPTYAHDLYISELVDAKPTDKELIAHANSATTNLLKLKQYLEAGAYYNVDYSSSITKNLSDSSYTVWHPVTDSRVKSYNDVKWVLNCYFTGDLSLDSVLEKYRDINGKLYTASSSDKTLPSFSLKFTRITNRSETSVEIAGEYTESGSSAKKIYVTFKYVDSKWRLAACTMAQQMYQAVAENNLISLGMYSNKEIIVEQFAKPIKVIKGEQIDLVINDTDYVMGIGRNAGIDKIKFDKKNNVKYFVTSNDLVVQNADAESYFKIVLTDEKINVKKSPYIAIGISINGPEISVFDTSIYLNYDGNQQNGNTDDRLWSKSYEYPSSLKNLVIDTTQYTKGGGNYSSGYSDIKKDDCFGAVRIRLANNGTKIPANTKVEIQYLAFFDDIQSAINYKY